MKSRNKFSFLTVFTIIALVSGAVLFVRQGRRLEKLREQEAFLIKEAGALGTGIDEVNRSTKVRRRESTAEVADRIADELVKLAFESRRSSANPETSYEQHLLNGLRSSEKLLEASPAELKEIYHRLLTRHELEEPGRSRLLASVIRQLAIHDPRSGLELVVTSDTGLSATRAMESVASEALYGWARENPHEMWKWLRAHEGIPPEWTSRSMVETLAVATARTEPKLAFEMLATLEGKATSNTVADILTSVESIEGRQVAMERFHKLVASGDIQRNEVLDRIGSRFRDSGFEKSSRWIEDAGLSQDELARVAGHVSSNRILDDAGRWVDFLAGKLSGDPLKKPVEELIDDWVQNDHVATENWLSTAPDSDAKTLATRRFVSNVSRYDPATAERWALALPEKDLRTETLNSIFRGWPENDPDGKESFGLRHEIESE